MLAPTRTHFVLALALTTGLGLGLTACGEGGDAGLLSSVLPGKDTRPLSFAWPPTVGESYPDLELKDYLGRRVKLSDFAGKVLLIEPIGMT